MTEIGRQFIESARLHPLGTGYTFAYVLLIRSICTAVSALKIFQLHKCLYYKNIFATV